MEEDPIVRADTLQSAVVLALELAKARRSERP